VSNRTELNMDDNSHDSCDDSYVSSEGEKCKKAMLYPVKSPKQLLSEDPRISELVRSIKRDEAVSPLGKGIFSSRRYSSIINTSLTFIPIPLTEVTSQLHFGSLEDAKNEKELRARQITHIISLIGPSHLIEGVSHKHSPMNDHGRTDLKVVFEELWPFILESQKPQNALFVHCMNGQNRSATLIIGILMKIEGKSLKDAFRMIKKKRPLVQINVLYAKQLSTMELELSGQNTMPENWMEVSFVDMNSGSVIFTGDDIFTMKSLQTTTRCPRSSIQSNSYNKDSIEEKERPLESRTYSFRI